MNNITFVDEAFDQYLAWQDGDAKMRKRINRMLKDIRRNGYEGIGKPEPLKHELHGWWSRRIDEVNRIVFRVHGDDVEILQCGAHYSD